MIQKVRFARGNTNLKGIQARIQVAIHWNIGPTLWQLYARIQARIHGSYTLAISTQGREICTNLKELLIQNLERQSLKNPSFSNTCSWAQQFKAITYRCLSKYVGILNAFFANETQFAKESTIKIPVLLIPLVS